jgi:glutamate dehydrogenase
LRIVDTTPKHFVLSSDQEALHVQVSLLLEAQQRGERACVVRWDRARRGVWAVVALPSFELTPEIRTAVLGAFANYLEVSSHTPDVFITNLDEPLCRIYLYSPSRSKRASSQEALHSLETLLLEESKGWTSALRGLLAIEERKEGRSRISTHQSGTSTNGAGPAEHRSGHFSTAFPDDYQAVHSPDEAVQDVSLFRTLSHDRPLAVNLSTRASGDGTEECFLTVCQLGSEITLSRSLPILEHAGFEVLHERAWRIRPSGGQDIFLHRFPVRMRSIQGKEVPFPGTLERQSVVAHGIEQVLSGRCEDDILNSLMATAGLSVSSLSLLRAYCMLLWQVRKFATRQTIREAFSNHPAFALKFWEVAKIKFDPTRSVNLVERKALVDQEMAALKSALHEITDITADRILRALVSLLQLTVRTNFFIPRSAPGAQPPGPQPEVVALKIHSEQLELLTHPRPLFEIFVSAPAFEGVHLRASRVARGGIRWSDRREDFRTEVRDLMRTQQVKNAIIVPSGAKGGFVVKELPLGREAQGAAVRQCYQEFIRALLSITDNRVHDAVVPPPGVVCHDEPDPYLVVAADKGTASFSDVANAIAVEEFNFWLGDAFASGGSNGYDHKRLGVTARGAWEAVRQHFKVAKIDFERTPFTVVGIGDMSGDVFGNGLLESKNIKLIGAFNHRHIFIDPNPDPSSSWKERSRLFNLPFSQWSDYDPALISPGGMVAERAAKEIRLSAEARTALAVPPDAPELMSGEQVISLILKAPVDLLWNGGIGTYIKSRSESDGDVDDSANDSVRVCADEVRARVIAEGGNLGLTQRARIEYAGRGGLINTDAIDNSGGVDTSDHEVNLKILFSGEVKAGRLSLEERNKILRELSSEVVNSVLSHNRGQAILLASSAERGSKNLEYFKSLINDLTRRGYLNRAVHILPSDQTLEERARKGLGLFRPELAMCTAGVKLWMKDELLQSGVTSDPALTPFLMDYFPSAVQERFVEAIKRHPLAANIIATRVANDLIETVGLTFVHRICLSHSVEPAAVMRALAAAHALLNTAHRKAVIQKFDTFEHHERFLQLRIELSAALREATAWLISRDPTPSGGHQQTPGALSIQTLTQTYAQGLRRLFDEPLRLLSGKLHGYVVERLPLYEGLELGAPSALNFAVSPLTPTLFEIVSVSQQVASSSAAPNDPLATAALTYSTLVDTLGIYEILAAQRRIKTTSKWEHELLLSSYDDIRRATAALSVSIIERGAKNSQEVARLFSEMPGAERLRVAAQGFTDGTPQVAWVSVFARLLRAFSLGS